MTYRSPLKSSVGPQSIQSAVGGRPMSGIAEQSIETVVATDTTEITTLQAQLASLQAQLAQAQAALAAAQAQNAADAQTIAALQAQVTSLQAQVSALQAQAVIDAATIASLQAQVASLQAQVAALSNPMYSRFIMASIVEVGGGIYVPPYFDDQTVSLTKVNTYESAKSITTTGGGYP